LEQTVRDAVRMLAPRAREKGLELEQAYAPDCPRLLIGDAGRIRQILLNLAGNAIKFTHQGRVSIRITRQVDDAQHPGVLIAVEDTGIGIPADKRGHLFESFTQADSSTTRQYGGTGLGLAISKSLVELMGGDMGVESEPGRGSTFWLSLKLPQAGIDEARIGEPPAAAGMAGGQGLPPSRVLLAEDVPTNQKVAASMLSRLGLEVEIASDGREAVGLQPKGGVTAAGVPRTGSEPRPSPA